MSTVAINENGFTVLKDPMNAIVDIVFIHGLQGHPRKTWTFERISASRPQDVKQPIKSSHRGIKKLFSRKYRFESKDARKPEADEVFWPLDLLPDNCPSSRILTWGYDSNISQFFGGAANQSNITAYAKDLLAALKLRRLDCQGRSLVFVAHSVGGVIVKDILHRAACDADPTLSDIYTSTEAVLFLGTPHRGSGKAGAAEEIRQIISVSVLDTAGQDLRPLKINSREVESINELFFQLCNEKDRRFKVLAFQEAKDVAGTSYLKLNERVVEPSSLLFIGSEPIQTINADYTSMCRFASRDDEGYKKISGEIEIIVREVQKRMERTVLEQENQFSHSKTGSLSQMTTTSASYSLNEVERKCVALLTQHTSNAAEIADYKSSLPSRVEGTCQWILSHSQYHDWNIRKEACLLWICGYPGSGKTILSAYLLEYLEGGEVSPSLRTTLCYFFCDEKIDTQRDGMAILRSLIHQLLVRRRLLIKHVKNAYDRYGPQFDQNFSGLWRIFLAIASDKRIGPISVIIDAIDECEETTRGKFCRDVVNLISKSRLRNSKLPRIKFLFTSRPSIGRQYTTNLLQMDPSQNHVEQDLNLVIKTKVEAIVRRIRCKPDVQKWLEDALSSKSDRTFLWVTLVLHLLERSALASQSDFKRIIDGLPKTLTATYERFLHEISSEYQPLATRLLHFLVGSSRPLTLEEMRILMAIQDHHRSLAALEEDAQPNIQETIEGVLGPLVRIWNSRIYLVHQSLKEFLLTLSAQKHNPLSRIYGVDSRRASLLMAETCVSYLLLDDFKEDIFSQDQLSIRDSPTSSVARSADAESIGSFWDTLGLGEDTLFKEPAILEAEACASIRTLYLFFDYSASYWADHFSAACSGSSTQLQDSAIILSDTSQFRGSNWLRYYWHHAETSLPYPEDFLPLVVASYFGHSTTMKSLLHDGLMDSTLGERALYWASRIGHRVIVDLLLQEPIDPDAKVIDGQNALIAAVRFNHPDVVERLLEDDGWMEEGNTYRVNYPAMGGRTPLSIAAGNGNVEIVEQLLRHNRIQPDIADFKQWTPLFWSVDEKHLSVLKMLVADNRVDVNHVDTSGRNVLSWAASMGEVDYVKYLLGLERLRCHETDRNGRTALSWAAGNGHLETTMYLRRTQRIDIRSKDKDGRNALSWACGGGYHKVVEYLIKYDPKGVDEEDVDGWAPLAWALFNQAPQTVQMLLDSGLVDVNKKDKGRRTALAWAADYGYLDVVQILLKTPEIEIDSRDISGLTPLDRAQRYPDVANLLQNASK